MKSFRFTSGKNANPRAMGAVLLAASLVLSSVSPVSAEPVESVYEIRSELSTTDTAVTVGYVTEPEVRVQIINSGTASLTDLGIVLESAEAGGSSAALFLVTVDENGTEVLLPVPKSEELNAYVVAKEAYLKEQEKEDDSEEEESESESELEEATEENTQAESGSIAENAEDTPALTESVTAEPEIAVPAAAEPEAAVPVATDALAEAPVSNPDTEVTVEQNEVPITQTGESFAENAAYEQLLTAWSVLPAGGVLTVAVRFAVGMNVGSHEEVVRVSARELAAQTIGVGITVAPAEDETESDSETEDETETESEEESESEEETEDTEMAETPQIRLVSRSGGFYQSNVYYASMDVSYRIEASVAEKENTVLPELCYKWGELEGTAEWSDQAADIVLSGERAGFVNIYYVGKDGEKISLVSEYVVSEHTAPQIAVNELQTEAGKRLHVTIAENGNVRSGIGEYQCFADGEAVEIADAVVTGSGESADGTVVPMTIEFDLVPADNEEHIYEIDAADVIGNLSVESYGARRAVVESEAEDVEDEDDIVIVTLPTTFAIPIYAMENQEQIRGENIVIQNRSSFPVDVKVTNVNVKSADTFGADMSLAVFEDGGVKRQIALNRGDNNDIVSFVLGEKETEESREALCDDYGKENVRSGDYALLSVRGDLRENGLDNWQDGDLIVNLVFSFDKAEEDAAEGQEEDVPEKDEEADAKSEDEETESTEF